jgi:hypothetical protein
MCSTKIEIIKESGRLSEFYDNPELFVYKDKNVIDNSD